MHFSTISNKKIHQKPLEIENLDIFWFIVKSFSRKVLKTLQEDLSKSWIATKLTFTVKRIHSISRDSPSEGDQQKSAKISNIPAQPVVAAFPGASQQPPSAANSSSLPRGQPAFPGASSSLPRGQPAVSQSTSQNGIIHTHLDHVNMSQCTFSFYVICYLYWFGCVSLPFQLLASHFNWSKVATLHTFFYFQKPLSFWVLGSVGCLWLSGVVLA